MAKQLRQLFQAPNAVTKGYIFQEVEAKTLLQGDDPSYEAWLAFRNKQKETEVREPRMPLAPPRGPRVRSPNREKGRKRKMDFIVSLGNATGVTAVEAKIIFCPNAQ